MAISRQSFPDLQATERGLWAPIFLSPILGSPERFVIAVVAATQGDFHIEVANALNRLFHLYGDAAEMALFATEVAISELEAALADEGPGALRSGALVFSGVNIGEVSSGEASSIEQLAKTWMSSLSSLYKAPVGIERAIANTDGESFSDRLPTLVHDHLFVHHPAVVRFFSDEIKNKRVRRSRLAGVSIDFSGSNVVANLATLSRGNHAKSVDMIKRKMFDLIVRRDKEHSSMFPRAHEMIVFSPDDQSPLVTERQVELIRETHEELSEQSRREEVEFVPLAEVPAIGERLANLELRIAV